VVVCKTPSQSTPWRLASARQNARRRAQNSARLLIGADRAARFSMLMLFYAAFVRGFFLVSASRLEKVTSLFLPILKLSTRSSLINRHIVSWPTPNNSQAR
jgi:hypothetical protein